MDDSKESLMDEIQLIAAQIRADTRKRRQRVLRRYAGVFLAGALAGGSVTGIIEGYHTYQRIHQRRIYTASAQRLKV